MVWLRLETWFILCIKEKRYLIASFTVFEASIDEINRLLIIGYRNDHEIFDVDLAEIVVLTDF